MRWAVTTRCVATLAASLALAAAHACEVRIAASHGATELQAIHLGRLRHIDLTYIHSVTQTPVRETLAVDGHGFEQQRIEFFVQGPGLPTEALPGERFQRLPDRFIFDHMHRRMAVLDMRVDPAQAQMLEAGDHAYSLTRWGATALTLTAVGCD